MLKTETRAHLLGKATLLHARHHKGVLREGLSRPYYDLVMLDRAGVTDEALAHLDLLARGSPQQEPDIPG